MITINHKGPLRVVRFNELETWTAAGWRLVAMYQESGVDTLMEEVTDELPQGDGSYGTVLCKRHYPRQDTHTQTYFILAQDEESALAELNEKLLHLQGQLKESEDAHRHVLDRSVKRGEEILALEHTTAALSDMVERRDALLDQRLDQLDKMEQDIARLRRHFGEKAINEALAEAVEE